jgi:hypothetical protein
VIRRVYAIAYSDTVGRPLVDSKVMPGNLSGEEPALRYVDFYTEVFCSVGMKMNSMKTKSITMYGGKPNCGLQHTHTNDRLTESGVSYYERRHRK